MHMQSTFGVLDCQPRVRLDIIGMRAMENIGVRPAVAFAPACAANRLEIPETPVRRALDAAEN